MDPHNNELCTRHRGAVSFSVELVNDRSTGFTIPCPSALLCTFHRKSLAFYEKQVLIRPKNVVLGAGKKVVQKSCCVLHGQIHTCGLGATKKFGFSVAN